MVCLACLLPLFLIPVVNALPLLFHLLMAKIYQLMGWEYRKPDRVPPSCPYKPSSTSTNTNLVANAAETESRSKDLHLKPVEANTSKND